MKFRNEKEKIKISSGIRHDIYNSIRNFFDEQNFLEVETPLLVKSVIPESYLTHFKTSLYDRRGNKKPAFLITSPEASIKKLLSLGIGNCYEITKSFRNGETDSNLHSIEFSILEWYRTGATYKDIMKDCENLVLHILRKLKSQKSKIKNQIITDLDVSQFIYQNNLIDFSPPWERISVPEALNKFSGINFEETVLPLNKNGHNAFDNAKILHVAAKKGYNVNSNNTWEEIFNQIYLNEIEPNLGTHGKPTIIYDFPKPMAALSKTKKTDRRLAERFEFYIGGLEIGDCYTELTDYPEQKSRFESEMNIIKHSDKENILMDMDFLESLKSGLPECAGIAVGLDRLIMLFSDTDKIQDTLLFPLTN